MQLRPYQNESVNAIYTHLQTRDDNPCAVIPTGGGKTPVIARICTDSVKLWGGRVLILAHVKELLEQAAEKLHVMSPELWADIGLYSAGLGSRDVEHSIIIGGIQSVYKRACDFGRFDLIIIDEAHMIPPDGEGMYQHFIRETKVINPNVRIIGLTATPYRMTTGMICEPANILNHVCYEVGVKELIAQGYLCKVRSRAGTEKPDTSSLHIRGGEYIAGEVEQMMDALSKPTVEEFLTLTKDRKAVLIFAAGVDHAKHIAERITQAGHLCGQVYGDTASDERAELLKQFKAGTLKYMVNVNVLTTGFDAPNIDCVIMLRPTLSPGLYYQMVGRGFRLCDGKDDCLVLDYGNNIITHGPIDDLRIKNRNGNGSGEAPAKECPQCKALIAAGYILCPDCGYMFPPKSKAVHETTASNESILSGETITTDDVIGIDYQVWTKRDNPNAPPTLRVDYQTAIGHYVSEWICIEHDGYAGEKARKWWERRCVLPMPDTVDEALDIALNHGLAAAEKIEYRKAPDSKFYRVTGYKLGDVPQLAGETTETTETPEPPAYNPPDDEIPF